MKHSCNIKSISALLLAMVMAFSMSSFALEDVLEPSELSEGTEQLNIDEQIEQDESTGIVENPNEDIETDDSIDEENVIQECRPLSDRTLGLTNLNINLRTMLGEDHSGYSVVQGSCTDGTYAYYLMVSSSNQHGRVLKVRISDQTVVARSAVLNTWHGNGMCYDSKRNVLAVIAREDRKQEITIIDANSLKITRQKTVKYTNAANTGTHSTRGLGAIAYVEKYDCYVALERELHNLIMFNPDSFEAIGLAITTINKKYPGTYQGMDADEQYVYLLLSAYNSDQPDNLIVAIDWNSENLQPILDGECSYISEKWYCGEGDGYPTAQLKLNGGYEAESIYHLGNASDGQEHFYLASYRSHTETRTVSYKVKWKKVWKKVKVKKKYKKKQWFNKKTKKWQNKKPKKKYRGATRKVTKYKTVKKRKKVWKYKTKYKKESYLARDNYVYDIGSF